MIFIFKLMRFIKNYLLKDPLYVVLYSFNYIRNNFKVTPTFYSENEVLNLIQKGYSYIRLGDGEIAIMRGYKIDYQKRDENLAKILKKIIIEYTNTSKYILALPERYLSQTNSELKKIGLFHCWLPFKVTYQQMFPKKTKYSDAHSFYVLGFFEKTIYPIIKDKKCIIITTSKNIEKQKPILEKYLDCVWFEAKSPNPFDWYEKNIQEVEDYFQSCNIESKDVIILLSAGPASKPLAWYFSKNSIQSIDVGHGFEYFFGDEGLDKVLI